jgi:stalled ribosome rescue protein Dom34
LGKYKVHRFDVKMTTDAQALEDFLNGLKGEVVAIVPNVTSRQLEYASVNFLLIVEKTVF